MNVGSTYYGFIYNRFVTGRNFLGRKKDLAVLENSLKSGESVAIYDEPGTGKMSLIQQALTHLRISSPDLAVAQLSFQRERSIDRMLCLLLDEVIRACASTPAQYREIVNTSLADTHFVFDQALFDVHGRIVGTNWVLDQKDIQSALELPDALAQNRGTGIIIVIDEFQNLLMAEDADKVLDIWEKIQARQERLCSYVFTGSRLNGMRDIFEVQRRFRHDVTRLIPECIPSGDIAEYVDRIFRNQGKVIEKEAIAENAVTLRCNMRYVNHLFSLVDYSTRGFVGNSDISDALETLMTIHEPRFSRQYAL